MKSENSLYASYEQRTWRVSVFEIKRYILRHKSVLIPHFRHLEENGTNDTQQLENDPRIFHKNLPEIIIYLKRKNYLIVKDLTTIFSRDLRQTPCSKKKEIHNY